MKTIKLSLTALCALLLLSYCHDNMHPDKMKQKRFTVKIENVLKSYDYFEAGAQFIPDQETEAGPAHPGQSFTIAFHAGKGHKLSFASMYGASNDLFYAPSSDGITLFDGDTPLTGDITDKIMLWDAGTEVNHAPGSGEDGDVESLPVKQLRNTDNVMDGFDYNNVEENIQVTLDYDGTSLFTLKINVLTNSSTPLSPVAWVVHSDMQQPIFTEGEPDRGQGLEDLAETGNAQPLSEYLAMMSGYSSPLSPGTWAIHLQGDHPIFTENEADYGDGLEAIAEMGDPSILYNSLMNMGYPAGVFSMPDGTASDAPIFNGESYTFSFDAEPGQYLSFALMLGKSNDLFLAPADGGIALFNGKKPFRGDVTSMFSLWDAGTEVNEYPGAGFHQGPGDIEENEPIMPVNDAFMWPDAAVTIKVTISHN